MSRELHVQFCERAGVRFPCATHLAIVCRPGQAEAIMARTKRWLSVKGLSLNESKSRVVDIRQTGINFLGFNLTWRKSLQRRPYLHVEPSQKSRAALRESLGGYSEPLDRMENHRLSGEGSEPSAAGMGWVLPLSEQYVSDERAQTVQSAAVAPVVMAQTRVPTGIVERLHR